MHDVYNDDQTFGLVENDLEESGEEEQKFRWEVYNNNFLGDLFVWMWLHIERTG